MGIRSETQRHREEKKNTVARSLTFRLSCQGYTYATFQCAVGAIVKLCIRMTINRVIFRVFRPGAHNSSPALIAIKSTRKIAQCMWYFQCAQSFDGNLSVAKRICTLDNSEFVAELNIKLITEFRCFFFCCLGRYFYPCRCKKKLKQL